MFHYLKYFSFHLVGLVAFCGLLMGGMVALSVLVGVVSFYLVGDAICGEDTTTPKFKYPQILTVQLWFALPLLTLIAFTAVWSIGNQDALGFGKMIYDVTGFNAIETRNAGFGNLVQMATGLNAIDAKEVGVWLYYVVAFVVLGLLIGLIGTITGHELTHRTWDPISMFIGRWLLAFSIDTIFSIEHVYGHHRYVATTIDPATAPRGRNVYTHIVVSTIKGNISAWNIEKGRLAKFGHGPFTWRNRVISGHLMSVFLVYLAYLVSGVPGLIFFVASALWGKSLLEIVNYMEHYGIVRNIDAPVEPRHSWNTNKRISSWTMFNLTRHSHHHAEGNVPYQDLKPYPDAPKMINGYLTTIIITMIPPLWNKLMTPKLLEWDQKYASPEELKLIQEANLKSGIDTLVAAAAAG